MMLVAAFLDVYRELADVIVNKIIPQYDVPAEVAAWTKEVRVYSVWCIRLVHVVGSLRWLGNSAVRFSMLRQHSSNCGGALT